MRIEANRADGNLIGIELEPIEASHLLSFLFHAKFSEDVRLEIVGSPTMNKLIRGLLEAQESIDPQDAPIDWRVSEEGGMQAPDSFLKIESRVRELVQDGEFEQALADYLYPYVWTNDPGKDRFVMPGTRVRLPTADATGRIGIVVDCRRNETSQLFECRVVELSSSEQEPELRIEAFRAQQLAIV